jgi:hypothetical protein
MNRTCSFPGERRPPLKGEESDIFVSHFTKSS